MPIYGLTPAPWLAWLRVVRRAMPPVGIGQRKTQDGGKQNGGSPCNLKMTSFEEIVRVADGKRVPDPFVNTKKIILEMCCVKEKPSFD